MKVLLRVPAGVEGPTVGTITEAGFAYRMRYAGPTAVDYLVTVPDSRAADRLARNIAGRLVVWETVA